MVKNRLRQIMVHFSGLIIIASISVPIAANDSDPNEKLADRRAKKQAKLGIEKKKDNTIPLDQVITLDHLTNPNKK